MMAMEQFAAVLIVLAFTVAAAAVLRKGSLRLFGLGSSSQPGEKSLYVMDRLTVSPQHSIVLVRWKGRDLLLGMSPAGWTLLREETQRERGE